MAAMRRRPFGFPDYGLTRVGSGRTFLMQDHVCIVTPSTPAANPRVVKEARALVGAGYRVSVVCGGYASWADELSSPFPSQVMVRPVCYGPGAPRRDRLRQLIRRTAFRRAAAVFAMREEIAFRAIGDIGPDLAAVARTVPADIYIGHYAEGLVAAARAARARNVPYGFDAEDFHPGDLPHTVAHARQNAIIDIIETSYLSGAAYVTAAAPLIAEAYSLFYGIAPPTVVHNVFPLKQAPAAPTFRGTAYPGPSLYWFSRTIGPRRGLETFVRAIGTAKSRPHLYLRGESSPDFIRKLRALAVEHNVEDQLHILPPAPQDAMVRLAADYDLGLSGEIGLTANRKLALSNKQFTYILAGVPVLLSDVPQHVAFARGVRGVARTYPGEDPTGLAAVIDDMLSDPGRLASLRASAFALGRERYNWDREQTVFLTCVAQALGNRICNVRSGVGSISRM